MKVALVGLAYVGLSNAVLLSQNNQVVAVDVVRDKVNMIKSFAAVKSAEQSRRFKRISDIVVANRVTEEVQGVSAGEYTKDLFYGD